MFPLYRIGLAKCQVAFIFAALLIICLPYPSAGEVRVNSNKLLNDAIEAEKDADYKKALNNLNAAIKFNPSDATLFGRRGQLLKKMGKKENAKTDLTKACDMGDTIACKLLAQLNEEIMETMMSKKKALAVYRCESNAPPEYDEKLKTLISRDKVFEYVGDGNWRFWDDYVRASDKVKLGKPADFPIYIFKEESRTKGSVQFQYYQNTRGVVFGRIKISDDGIDASWNCTGRWISGRP